MGGGEKDEAACQVLGVLAVVLPSEACRGYPIVVYKVNPEVNICIYLFISCAES